MKNLWLLWVFILGVIIIVFFAFNQKRDVPLDEIFPEQGASKVDIEYEFVGKDQPQHNTISETIQKESAQNLSLIEEEEVSDFSVSVESPKKKVSVVLKEKRKNKDILVSSYSVQVASFKNIDKAKEVLSKLKNKGHDAYIVSKNLKDLGLRHRVYVGKFEGKKEAEDLLPKLKKAYKSSFVIFTK